MAYSAQKNAQGSYDIFNNGQKVSTGSSSVLGNYGLSESNLGGGSATTAIASPPSGLKAAQPGGLSSSSNNTVASPYIAPPSQQTAGGPQYSSVAGAGMGSIIPSTPSYMPPATPAAPQASTGQTTPQNVAPKSSSVQTATGAQPVSLAPTGLMQQLIQQAMQNYQTQQAALQPSIQQNQQTIGDITQREAQLMGGSYSGTAADYSGRINALEQLRQQAQGNVNSALGNITNALTPSQNALTTSLGAATNYISSPYAQPIVNPATGQVISGGQTINQPSGTGFEPTGGGTGGINPATTLAIQPNDPAYAAMQQYAQMAANGQYNAIPSSITGNLVLNAQLNAMAGALNPNYNPIVSQAQGNATASNVQTQQTAEINALAQVYGDNAPKAYNLNTALNNIDSLGQLTLQTAQGGSVNPLTIPAGNQTISDFRRQLGSASQAAFDSNMANFQSALTAIYADTSGAIPTQVTQWGTQISNGSMPLAALQSVYKQALQEGGLRLENLKKTAGAAFQDLQGASPTGGSGSSSGTGTVSAGGYSFKQVNGVWQPVQ